MSSWCPLWAPTSVTPAWVLRGETGGLVLSSSPRWGVVTIYLLLSTYVSYVNCYLICVCHVVLVFVVFSRVRGGGFELHSFGLCVLLFFLRFWLESSIFGQGSCVCVHSRHIYSLRAASIPLWISKYSAPVAWATSFPGKASSPCPAMAVSAVFALLFIYKIRCTCRVPWAIRSKTEPFWEPRE